MRIQNSTANYNACSAKQSFKSVYPVYHWYKPADTYIPALRDISDVKRFQRILTGMLNSRTGTDKTTQNTFLQDLHNYIAEWDKDFKNLPFVRTFFNYNGGIKPTWNPDVSIIEPRAYLITGRDAVDFETLYGKPLGYAKSAALYGIEQTIHNRAEIESAKLTYAFGGKDFVDEGAKKFVSKDNKIPLELHVIMNSGKNTHKAKVVKARFFETNASNNPLITNGIGKNNID